MSKACMAVLVCLSIFALSGCGGGSNVPATPSTGDASSGQTKDPAADFAKLVESSDTVKVSKWLSENRDELNVQWKSTSALELLVTRGSPEMLDAFVQHGGNLNRKRSTGFSTLSKACQQQRSADNLIGIAQRLAKAGVDVNEPQQMGNCLTNFAMNPPMLTLPVEGTDRGRILDELIKLGADVNNPGTFKSSTPLHTAASFGDIALVEALLKRGANPNAAGKANLNQVDPDPNYTPRFVAMGKLNKAKPDARAKYQRIIEILESHGGK